MLCEDLDWLLWEHTGTEAVCDVTTPLILEAAVSSGELVLTAPPPQSPVFDI